MDQIVNEMAKFRFRSGNQWNCGGVTLRAPCGAVSLLFGSWLLMPNASLSTKKPLLSFISRLDMVDSTTVKVQRHTSHILLVWL
jgi:hypothetical protein